MADETQQDGQADVQTTTQPATLVSPQEPTVQDRLAALESGIEQLQLRVTEITANLNFQIQQLQAHFAIDATFRDSMTEKVEHLLFALQDIQANVAVAMLPKAAPSSADTNALLTRLEKHGIRIQDEDYAEVPGSGSERWGNGETWAEAHDEQGAPLA